MGTISITVAEYKRLLANELAIKWVLKHKGTDSAVWLSSNDVEAIEELVTVKEEDF